MYDICEKIDVKQFCQELRTLGFTLEQAAEISSWVDLIAGTEPGFLARKGGHVAKACLAYIGGQAYYGHKFLTQRKLCRFYNAYSPHLQTQHKKYLTILQKAKPETFNQIKTDFRITAHTYKLENSLKYSPN